MRVIVVALALALLAAACSSEGDEQTIRIYTGRHYDLEEAFAQYTEETGVKIEFLEGSDVELRERILAEGDETEADIYMTVDAGNLARASQDGIFAPIESEILEAAVPENLRDPNGEWFGLSARARTIVYSNERVDPSEVPSTYVELAQPEWEGRVCLRNSSNIYTQSLVASFIGNVGYDETLEIVEGWANNAEMLASDTTMLESVAAGECDVAIVNHYYLARLMEEEPDFPVDLVWADQTGRGTHVNVSGAGVTKFADNPELAQDLLEWLATEGQNIFVDGNHEYPVNPEVQPEALIAQSFGEAFVTDPLNAADFGGRNADAVRLLDEAGYE